MLRTRAWRSSVRLLSDRDTDEVLQLCDRDPVTNVFVSSRVHACGLDPARLGAQVWGYTESGRITSVCYSGANLIPVAATPAAVAAFADRARLQGRRCSSIVGPAGPVSELWTLLAPYWGRARAIRARQPLLTITAPPLVSADPLVRPATIDQLGLLFPAAVAMFTEEVGVSPLGADGGRSYRNRVSELIRAGHTFARIDNGTVVFKADIGAATPSACQIQGVWVPPQLRGRGHATGGMAAVVAGALASVAPVVSLYVNDFNEPARTAYQRVGFTQTGLFTSVLF